MKVIYKFRTYDDLMNFRLKIDEFNIYYFERLLYSIYANSYDDYAVDILFKNEDLFPVFVLYSGESRGQICTF